MDLRRGELDLYGEAAIGTRGGPEGGVVGGGDGADDGEAEAVVAVVGGGAVGGEALEGFEEAVDFGGWDDGAVVGDLEVGAAGLGAGPYLHLAAGDVVAHGVVEQVADEAAGEGSVALGWGWLQLGVDS